MIVSFIVKLYIFLSKLHVLDSYPPVLKFLSENPGLHVWIRLVLYMVAVPHSGQATGQRLESLVAHGALELLQFQVSKPVLLLLFPDLELEDPHIVVELLDFPFLLADPGPQFLLVALLLLSTLLYFSLECHQHLTRRRPLTSFDLAAAILVVLDLLLHFLYLLV